MDTALDFDQQLTLPSFYENPYPTYAALREVQPVYWSTAWNAWIVTRADDTVAILRDPQSFSNAGRFTAFLAGLGADGGVGVSAVRNHYASGMLQSDPPRHTHLRPLVNKAFTPRRVEEMRPKIGAIVDGMLEEVQGGGSFDLIARLAKPLPAVVISEMLGVPSADHGLMVGWSDSIANFQATATAELARVEEGGRAIHDLEEYFRDLLAERRKVPRDDLISALASVEEGGAGLSEPELLSMCTTLMVAGHETTRNLLGNALVCLFREPRQLKLVQENPSLLPQAIEEVLRFESPIQRGWRRIGRDTELRGQLLREGELVFMMLGAANRDPEVVEQPDHFDVERPPGRHLAFGFGIHFCLGAPLARMEGQVALEKLFEQMPKIAPDAPGFEWNQSVHLRGVKRLLVTA